MEFWRERHGDYATRLKNIQYGYLLNKYLKCSVWRLAVQYDTCVCVCVCVCVSLDSKGLTLIVLTCSIGWAPNSARKWHMGLNSTFKGLMWLHLFATLKMEATGFSKCYMCMEFRAALSRLTIWHHVKPISCKHFWPRTRLLKLSES
jgi:hypothetical protein